MRHLVLIQAATCIYKKIYIIIDIPNKNHHLQNNSQIILTL